MRDDFLTRDWADHHHDLARDIDKLFRTIGAGLARLDAKRFDAPWRRPADRAHVPAKR